MDPLDLHLPRQVGARALEWLDRCHGSLALDPAVPWYEIDEPSLGALAELALAAATVRRESVGSPETARTADRLLAFSWRQFHEGELLYELQRQTPAATYPMEIYSPLAALGYRHRALDRLLAHLSATRAAQVPEHSPGRRLAVAAAARRIGLPGHHDLAELTRRTWLGGVPEPWMLDGRGAHGVTRTVFHLTDRGADPAGLPAHLQRYLHQWLPAWLQAFTEARSWDLLGELLAVGACLEQPLFHAEAWAALAQAQQADGMLPGGATRPPSGPERAFRSHHPTITAAVAGTLALSRAIGSPRAAGVAS
ncbi:MULTISPECIES: DUF6895 family protein [Kitasatospora]|uniref:DUF6895 domain-containing protein n=1 Tax=Kitasatospora cystarginea TaxID=58350 RepID=A0ABN3DNU7_9ACTN